MKTLKLTTVLSVLTVGSMLVRAATTYSVTDLGSLGGNTTEAWAINNSRQITGNALDAGGRSHGFFWDSGVMTDLGRVSAWAINNSGVVAGHDGGGAFLYDGTMHALGVEVRGLTMGINDANQVTGRLGNSGPAFLYSGSTPVTRIEGVYSGPGHGADVNSHGAVVGDAFPGNDPNKDALAFHWDGMFTPLANLAGTWSSRARSINDSGQIVGHNTLGDPHNFVFRPVLWDSKDAEPLDLGGVGGGAYDINELGQIVGGVGYAVLWDAGEMIDLNDCIPADAPLDHLQTAHSINDFGDIVCTGTVGGTTRSFLLTPIPEPATYAAVMLAISTLFVWYRRRLG